MRRSEQDPFEGPDGPDLDPRPAREGRRRCRHPPVRAAAGRLLGAGERGAEHQCIRAGRDRLGQLAAAPHPAIGDDRDIAAGLGQEGITRGRDVADRGHLRDADPEHLAGRARRAGTDADEDRRGALVHQREGGLRVGRVPDRDGDRHVPGELRERERVVFGGEVAGRRDLALDEEQIGPVFSAERPEPPGRPRRRSDRRLRPGRVDLVETPNDQLLADRFTVGLGEQALDLVIGRRGDAIEDRGRFVVAGLDALEVQDREATEAGQRPGHPRIDDRVHRRGQDRDRKVDAAEGLAEIDVGRLDGVGTGCERDVLEPVGRADRVNLGMEDTALRGTGQLGRGGHPGSLDHVALLSNLTVALSLSRVYQRVSFGCPRSTPARWPPAVSSNQPARSGSERSSRIRSIAVR